MLGVRRGGYSELKRGDSAQVGWGDGSLGGQKPCGVYTTTRTYALCVRYSAGYILGGDARIDYAM